MLVHILVSWICLVLILMALMLYAYIRRWEKPAFVGASFQGLLLICSGEEHDHAVKSNNKVQTPKGRDLFVVPNSLWLDDPQVWKLQSRLHGFRRSLHVRIFNGGKNITIPIEVRDDLLIPNPNSNLWPQQVLEQFGPPTPDPVQFIQEEKRRLWKTNRKFMAIQSTIYILPHLVGLCMAILCFTGISAASKLLDAQPMKVTITQPGSSEAIKLLGVNGGNYRSELMVDDATAYVYKGTVAKHPRQIGGGLSNVCMGRPGVEICGLTKIAFNKGDVIYMRSGRIAKKSDGNQYEQEMDRWAIGPEEVSGLLDTGFVVIDTDKK